MSTSQLQVDAFMLVCLRSFWAAPVPTSTEDSSPIQGDQMLVAPLVLRSMLMDEMSHTSKIKRTLVLRAQQFVQQFVGAIQLSSLQHF